LAAIAVKLPKILFITNRAATPLRPGNSFLEEKARTIARSSNRESVSAIAGRAALDPGEGISAGRVADLRNSVFVSIGGLSRQLTSGYGAADLGMK
jgi:hypothetical protein